jgi:hypothetical protein
LINIKDNNITSPRITNNKFQRQNKLKVDLCLSGVRQIFIPLYNGNISLIYNLLIVRKKHIEGYICIQQLEVNIKPNFFQVIMITDQEELIG